MISPGIEIWHPRSRLARRRSLMARITPTGTDLRGRQNFYSKYVPELEELIEKPQELQRREEEGAAEKLANSSIPH